MEAIGDITIAESKIINQLKALFSHFHLAGQTEVTDLGKSLEILKSLRHLVYEDMNQLQHEALILKTAKYIQTTNYPTVAINWSWNPRQTGSKDEPDLQGFSQGKAIISAEVTTSLSPQGTIDSRMAKTLEKLSKMAGDKYYVIITEKMEMRARSKLDNLGYRINVLRL
ncbi:MAG: hypothetical protein JW967_03810 [Dehalococcoidales bacterium]|nr:hypothetical protein [Dehalococcoidales bacterium]